MCVWVSRAGARAAGGLGRPGEACEKDLGQEVGGLMAETGLCLGLGDGEEGTEGEEECSEEELNSFFGIYACLSTSAS